MLSLLAITGGGTVGAVRAASVDLRQPSGTRANAARVAAIPPAVVASPRRPRFIGDPIPFGLQRKAEMAAYVRRHYGSFMRPTWRLTTRT